MNVLLLGATGLIGSAVLEELTKHGHAVTALTRSEGSARQLHGKNVRLLHGDLRAPEDWISALDTVDAVVHAAATFSDDMGDVDRHLIETAVSAAEGRDAPLRFIYTGGCWLYGETGHLAAREGHPFNPISSFSWMVENAEILLGSRAIAASIIHPAMVYHRDGGAIARFLETLRNGNPPEVWGSTDTRWPMVEHRDLAVAYRLVLEKGLKDRHYNVAAQEHVQIGTLVQALSRRFGVSGPPELRSRDEVVREHGAWAIGPTLDQGMSSRRIREELGWSPKWTDAAAEIGRGGG